MQQKVTAISKQRLSKNLMAWPDITAFCLELRKSYLKSKFTAIDDKYLIKMIFSEIVANKERKWVSKKSS